MIWQANCFMGIESNFPKPMCFEGLPAGVASGAGIAASQNLPSILSPDGAKSGREPQKASRGMHAKPTLPARSRQAAEHAGRHSAAQRLSSLNINRLTSLTGFARDPDPTKRDTIPQNGLSFEVPMPRRMHRGGA
jgi:hypothetical protein